MDDRALPAAHEACSRYWHRWRYLWPTDEPPTQLYCHVCGVQGSTPYDLWGRPGTWLYDQHKGEGYTTELGKAAWLVTHVRQGEHQWVEADAFVPFLHCWLCGMEKPPEVMRRPGESLQTLFLSSPNFPEPDLLLDVVAAAGPLDVLLALPSAKDVVEFGAQTLGHPYFRGLVHVFDREALTCSLAHAFWDGEDRSLFVQLAALRRAGRPILLHYAQRPA